jgi:AraC-like DNA-binding protein
LEKSITVMKPSIPNYCDNRTLLIPQSLHDMADAFPVMSHNEAAIFFKCIEQNVINIEFYTNMPCLAFVLSGEETFTVFDHQQIRLTNSEMLFMPKNMYLISDFIRTNGPLRAFLFFFDRPTVEAFLRRTPFNEVTGAADMRPYKIAANGAISKYMQALYEIYKDINGTPELLRIKLLELLFLIDALDDRKRLREFLTAAHANNEKRNILYLMKEHRFHNMSVQDYATLSGRSLSSFTRDFKRQFGTTPRQWLIETRLERAMELINETRMSVTEISLEIGYDNVSHFIRAFKMKYGKTPKQARGGLFC